MRKNRIKVYWLLLLVLLYTAGAVLSVGETQARYVNTATWTTVVQQENTGVTSDCLEAVSDPSKFIVLLGALSRQQYAIPFTLTSSEAVSGSFSWTVDQPQYVDLEMSIGDTVITPETTVEIAAGDTIEVVMTLSMPETVFTEVREAMNVSVKVSWDDTLHGTFLAQLPAVEEEEDPTEATEPDPTEGTEPDPTEVTEPDPTEETEPDSTEVTEPDPTEETEPDPTEVTEPDPTEETEPDPTEATEPDPTEETEPDPTDPETNPEVVSGEPEETEPSEPAQPEQLPVPEIPVNHFAVSIRPERIPVVMTSNIPVNTETDPSEPEEAGSGETPVAETEPAPSEEPSEVSEDPTEASEDPTEPSEDATEPSEDPTEPSEDPTEPSEDSTEPSEDPTEPSEPAQEEKTLTPILLEAISAVNTAGTLPIQVTAPETTGPIRLGMAAVTEPADLEETSRTVLENFPRYTRYSLDDGAIYYMLYYPDTIALNPQPGETISVLLDLSHVELSSSQVVLGASHGENAVVSTCTTTVIPESATSATLSSRILSLDMPLEITAGTYWSGYTLEFTVEMLTTIKSEDGETMEYVAVELTEDGLWAQVETGETGTTLTFSIGEKLPPAGTYRVSMNWMQGETCCAQMQETFFINYSVYTESEQTGGAEQ